MNVVGYRDLKKLTEGSDRVVYTGFRESDQKPVILNALRSEHPSSDALALMYHEYEISKDLNLPGILETYDLIDEHNQFALVQENMQGISLQEYLRQNPIQTISIFFKLAIPMAKIIGELHQHHIIHKDIKPSSFIIHVETLDEKLTDFNFSSKLLHEVQDVVPPNKLEGTLDYMAPEQTGRMNMNIDYRVDFYALGVSFYEMLTGTLPFTFEDPLELLHAHLANPIPALISTQCEIPPMLEKIVQKLMSKNPADRYQSAIGLKADLERCQEEYEKTGKIEDFRLGEKDVFDHLNLSQKLYGRESEAKLLLAAYDRVSKGSVEGLMVCGYSGIGKTMLINEVHKPMVKQRGYFIAGKFDQLERNTPYTAITQALNQLARLILAEPEERFKKIKQNIIEVLGASGQVILDLSPDFERIIGPQPPLEKLSATEMQGRLMVSFKHFLEVLACESHPLVLFIDDLQWADNGSLKLLEYVLTDDELSHVLLIGAYRDNEVGEFHPLRLFLNDMQKRHRKISSLPLAPLSLENYEALFRDSFNRLDEAIKPFAELIHKRTEGNPFFCKQVILTLYRENILYFDYEKKVWNWSLDKINALKITDNVVDLMLHKLSELPENTQTLLKYAACIGNRFSIEMLMLISGQSAEEIAKAIWPALNQELVLTPRHSYKHMDAMSHQNLSANVLKEITFQFIHDKVQQAAYQSITLEEKQDTHLRVARLLLEKEPEVAEKERLFELVDHYNEAHALLGSAEKIRVVELNHKASMRAFDANAYQTMFNYLKAALDLFQEEWWETHYDLSFKIYRDYGFSLYLLNKIEESRVMVNSILRRAKSNLEKVSLYRILIIGYSAEAKVNSVMKTGKIALELLGVPFLIKPSKRQLVMKILKIRWKLRSYNLDNLDKELELAKSPIALATFEILSLIYQSAMELGVLVSGYTGLLGVELMLRYGKSKESAEFMVIYGYLSLMLFKDVDALFQYWNIAEKMYQELPDKYSSAMYSLGMSREYNHLRFHVKESEKYYRRAIKHGTESGNVLMASSAKLNFAAIYPFELAKSVTDTIRGSKVSLDPEQVGEIDQYTSSILGLVLVIMEIFAYGEDADRLGRFNDCIELARKSESANLSTWADKFASFYYYFMESYDNAAIHHQLWYVNQNAIKFDPMPFEIKATDALALVRCMPMVSIWKRWQYKRRFNEILQELKWASDKCPINYRHHYLFLMGIKEKLRGNYLEAINQFDLAIDNAKKGDFYLWVGLGNELAGDMLMDLKHSRAANDYIREAHYYYERYGINVKVRSLEERYPECFLEKTEIAKSTAKDDKATRHTVTTTTSASLDFMSVIKASQTISGEIILEQLFRKMLHIVIENAGAEKTLFLERVENNWLVVASLKMQQGEEEFKMLNLALKECQYLPQTMIQYSFRSEETVVLNNAAEDSNYRHDPYIIQAKPKSVLCLPILHHDKVLGVIYLENNLTIGAFTKDRITVLKTLSSQIAISLENARHFELVEKLYRSTERFVPRQFLEMLNRKTIEEIKLGDSLRLTISVLFADIRKFTTILETLDPEAAFAFVNRYWAVTAPVIRKYKGFINQYQGDGILALFPSSSDDAVAAGMGMLDVLKEFNAEQKKMSAPELEIGVGINSGSAMIGIIGEKERLEPAVVSDVANTASRVETLNKTYGTHFLLSGDSFNSMKNPEKYQSRIIDKVRLKGRSSTTYLHEIIDWESQLQNVSLKDYLAEYSQAFASYENGDFAGAKAKLEACLQHRSNDQVAEMLRVRCEEFLKEGTPNGWDGVYTLTHK